MRNSEVSDLEVSIKKLERKNRMLKKEASKLKKDNFVLIDENERLQQKVKEIVEESEMRLNKIRSKLIELGEEELIVLFED